jgi:hypothetical protein
LMRSWHRARLIRANAKIAMVEVSDALSSAKRYAAA